MPKVNLLWVKVGLETTAVEKIFETSSSADMKSRNTGKF